MLAQNPRIPQVGNARREVTAANPCARLGHGGSAFRRYFFRRNEEIAALLTEKGIRRVPVVREGRLVGVVSRADVVRAIAGR